MTDLGLWSDWRALSRINKTLALLICGVSVYSLVLSLRSLVAVHALKTGDAEKSSANALLRVLRHRLWNLRQLHLFCLYFFGFCILVQIPGVFHTMSVSYDIPREAIIRTLEFLFEFDASVFLVFLAVHLVQWLASTRVESLLRSYS